MNEKAQLPERQKANFPYRGQNLPHSLTLQLTLRTAQTIVIMTPLAGEHDLNEDDLWMQLVYTVFSEKSYGK